MKKILLILFLLVSAVCYGQGKYSTCKVYQYRGDDSTNIKLVLTEQHNNDGRVAFAEYNNYGTQQYYLPTNLIYDGIGKTYKKYKDTFLYEKIVIKPDNYIDENNQEKLDFKGCDTEKTIYNYLLDTNSQITRKIETHTAYKSNRPSMYDNIIPTDSFWKLWQFIYSDTTYYLYNQCGIAEEITIDYHGEGYRDVYRYPNSWDETEINSCKLDYIIHYQSNADKPQIANYSVYGIELYKYYQDSFKIYRTHSLNPSVINDTTGQVPLESDTYIYDSKKLVIQEKHYSRFRDDYKLGLYLVYKYYYPDNRIKKIISIGPDQMKLTHLYTYE